MPKQNPNKPTKTTIRDIIGNDAVDAICDEVREAKPKYLVCIWTEGEDDTLRWNTNAMTDAMFVYMLEVTKFEFLTQGNQGD